MWVPPAEFTQDRANNLPRVCQRKDLFVQFLGWYENRQSIFIVMEFIEYGDLGQYLKSGQEARSKAREITRQVLEGLVVLHGRDICHRDLKPEVWLQFRISMRDTC